MQAAGHKLLPAGSFYSLTSWEVRHGSRDTCYVQPSLPLEMTLNLKNMFFLDGRLLLTGQTFHYITSAQHKLALTAEYVLTTLNVKMFSIPKAKTTVILPQGGTMTFLGRDVPLGLLFYTRSCSIAFCRPILD